MADTPPQSKVHWGANVSISDFGSPFSQASSNSQYSSSSLQYLNAQLVAHGFAPSPGLCFDGLSATDTDRILKCFMAMLGQRVDDMARTEQLSAQLRTLSYDHERLIVTHRAATDKTANAERELNLFKSRLGSATRSLQSSESSHKRTIAELQRTRSVLQALRQTHASELKKRDVQAERMQDRWSKIADLQGQLGKIGSGISFKCGNATAVECNQDSVRAKGYLDVALEHAEEARMRLEVETLKLKRLAVQALNELHDLLYYIRRELMSEAVDEPVPLSLATLFPLHQPSTASEALHSVLTSLKASVKTLSQSIPLHATDIISASNAPVESQLEAHRLTQIIDTLRSQLDEAKKATQSAQADVQKMFEQFTAGQACCKSGSTFVSDLSTDLLTAPAHDSESARLQELQAQLDDERVKFTEATVRLGKERVAMQAERLTFLEEKRAWQVQQMLADLPPTPQPSSSSIPCNQLSESRTSPKPKKAKIRSPRKPKVSLKPQSAASTLRQSPRKNKKGRTTGGRIIEFAGETELIGDLGLDPRDRHRDKALHDADLSNGSAVAINDLGPAQEQQPSHQIIANNAKQQTLCTERSPPAAPHRLLPTSFVLPPPSPDASLPRKPVILSSTPLVLPVLAPRGTSPPPETAFLSAPLKCTAGSDLSAKPTLNQQIGAFPYPVAKPLAQRMIHAYSPARPSPLSRVLELATSPERTKDSVLAHLAAVHEDRDESQDSDVVQAEKSEELFPRIQVTAVTGHSAEFGGESESERGSPAGRESPLQEKKLSANAIVRAAEDGKPRTCKPTRMPAAKHPLVRNKAGPGPSSLAARSVALTGRRVLEKENKLDGTILQSGIAGDVKGKEKARKVPLPKEAHPAATKSSTLASTAGTAPKASMKSATSTMTESRARLMAKIPLPPAGGAGRGMGPRRVLIDSAEAPAIMKSKKL